MISSATLWLLTLTVAAIFVGLFEYAWREKGYKASIQDSKQLWSIERSKANNDNAIVFLGASRTVFGVNLETVKAMLPEFEPVMLAINGRYPLATLKSLASDKAFAGTVLVDIDARGLAPVNRWHQSEYVRYYEKSWSPSWHLHRRMLTLWQARMASARPELGAIPVATRFLENAPPPWRPHSTFFGNRTGVLDFSGIDPAAAANSFAAGLEQDLQENPPLSPDLWLKSLENVATWVSQIEARGGSVILYETPVSGRQRDLAEKAYPREIYWDQIAPHFDIPTFNYRDVPALSELPLPDESHVGGGDRGRYTRLLLNELLARGFFDRNEVAGQD